MKMALFSVLVLGLAICGCGPGHGLSIEHSRGNLIHGGQAFRIFDLRDLGQGLESKSANDIPVCYVGWTEGFHLFYAPWIKKVSSGKTNRFAIRQEDCTVEGGRLATQEPSCWHRHVEVRGGKYVVTMYDYWTADFSSLSNPSEITNLIRDFCPSRVMFELIGSGVAEGDLSSQVVAKYLRSNDKNTSEKVAIAYYSDGHESQVVQLFERKHGYWRMSDESDVSLGGSELGLELIDVDCDGFDEAVLRATTEDGNHFLAVARVKDGEVELITPQPPACSPMGPTVRVVDGSEGCAKDIIVYNTEVEDVTKGRQIVFRFDPVTETYRKTE